MMYLYSALTGLFIFSIIEPSWEYNLKCEIVVGTPIPCNYKMHFLPQLIVYLVLITIVSVIMIMNMKTKPE